MLKWANNLVYGGGKLDGLFATVVLCAVMICGMAVSAEGAVVTVAKTGDWGDSATWTGGVLPGATDTVAWNSAGYVVTATADQINSVQGLTLTGTLKSTAITDASKLKLNSGNLYVNTVGTTLTNTGSLIWSYANNKTGITVNGDYVQNSGDMVLTGGAERDFCFLNATNITLKAGAIHLGNHAANTYASVKGETFTLEKGASVHPYTGARNYSASFAINSNVANIHGKLGYYWADHGQHNLDYLTVAWTGYTSTVNFDGTSEVKDLWLGAGGVATLNQTGGTIKVTGTAGMYVNASNGGSATYNISGGELTTSNLYRNLGTGKGFIGQTGGTINVSNTLGLGNTNNLLAGKTALYELSGGTLNTKNMTGASNLLKLSGGFLNTDSVTGNLFNDGTVIAPYTAGGATTISGKYTQTDGSIVANGLSAGSVEFTGGELLIDLSQGDASTQITGDVFLGNNFLLTLDDDYADTSVKYALTAGSMSGIPFGTIFANSVEAGNISDLWMYSASANGFEVGLNPSAVPEPATWVMMVLGLMWITFRKKLSL